MAYYFMVETKKGEYQPLNISKSKYFPVVKPKYKKENAHTLQEIDQFTTLFNDEIELRKILLEEGILPLEYALKPLSTRFLNKNEYNKVMYDFLYQKDIEYIISPTKIIETIMKEYYRNNFLFIQKLANHFSKHYECSTTAPEIARLAETSIRQGRRHRSLDELDQNKNNMVTRLIKLLILKHTEKFDGKIEYKDEINYKNLHAIIAFLNRYFEPEQKQISLEEILPKKKEEEKNIQVKKRVRRKRQELDGQLNFEDLMS